ncbi:MAG TPA: hypothetical protein VE643_02825, partial [Nitrososphaeraceae archaeon]|nr:hypothetical protein [Nitrososphaeraceae archaeon]
SCTHWFSNNVSVRSYKRDQNFLNSSLERKSFKPYNILTTNKPMKEVIFTLRLTDEQYAEIRKYLDFLSIDMILFGLRFAYKRNTAIAGGFLAPGRKSIIKKETFLLSPKQAKWRLDNWKSMIRSYRERGYSYPTISRIKKEVKKKSLKLHR